MKITVIICTHNPRADHLARTLEGLRAQTLPASNWELLLIDNRSTPPLSPAQFPFFPALRIVREETLGLAAARLRGIAEATGNLFVFVDDDNVLAPDFLQEAAALATRFPTLGAFGGQVRGDFEIPPSPWFAARLDRLAIHEFTATTRTREPIATLAPRGAGLCVRAEVARHHRARALADPRRLALGRTGRRLAAGDDTDLALTACDLGMEIGLFPQLRLAHLIPRERLTLRYFARLTRGLARSHLDLLALRPGKASYRDICYSRLVLWKWTAIDAALSLLPPPRPPAPPPAPPA